MSAVGDERKAKGRTTDRLADLVEDAAVLTLVFSFMVLVAVVIAAALLV